MTIIKSLSMKGFKSFANKTELPFGQGFNIFIGPNGAGKSNICDAMCFVLGKSSAKEMRAERTSHLIYNGGKKGRPASEAEVTIEFDNNSGMFPIQAKEVKLSRVVKQNGTSTYKINGETHTRQQVRDLLTAARVDPDGHNIILQGDIISFMEMKPVERRMIIEQIAGISAYEEKKQKCLLELTKVDTKLNEAEIILKEREANLRELKKDRDQAVQYKELESAIKSDKATLVHFNIKNKEEHVHEIETRKKDIESKITRAAEELTGIKQKITDLKTEITTITKELDAKGEQEQRILRKTIEEIKESAIKTTSRLEVIHAETEKIKSRKTALLQDIETIRAKLQELTEQKKTTGSLVKQFTAEKTALDTKIAHFREKHGFDQDATNLLESIEHDLETGQTTIAHLQEQKQEILRKNDQFTFKIQACEERIQALQGTSNTTDAALLKEKKTALQESAARVSKVTNEDSSLANQLTNARNDLQKHAQELAKLKGRNISIIEHQTADNAVRKILDKKTNIKGIYGTVAELGKVKSTYALALEVAAGGRLKSVVVDTDATAQRCIHYLKENKIGIATFLPLNKVKERVLDEQTKKVLTEKKDIHDLAINLVTFDKKYAPVFSYVFGSTVVVDTIDAARRIGVGRARMVTLTGDLLEPSGAMIGGFRARTGIGFQEEDTTAQLQKLEPEITKLQTLIEHLEQKRITNEELLRKLRKEKAELEVDVIKLEKNLNINGTDITTLEEEKKNILDTKKETDKAIQTLEETLKKYYHAIELLKTKRAKVREKLATPEIAQTIESFETTKTKLTEKLTEAVTTLKGLDIQYNSILLPELEKAEKIIKQQEKEHENFIQEERGLQEALKQRDRELKTKENDERTFFSNLKDLALKRAKLSEKTQTHETNIAREEEKHRALEQRLNGITIERAKAIAELEALQHEFTPYADVKLVRGASIDELRGRISQTERDLAKIGNVNLRALEVYEDIQKEHKLLVEKTETIKKEKEDILIVMQEVESKKADVFYKTYNAIVKNFKTIFSNLTTKGEAHVELENPQDPFAGGMDIQIKIANNKTLDMKSLSGGEKTMAALAFIFAIQEYAPSPFYLLDEVDAALDKKNSALLSQLVQRYAQKAQYLVVSHNDSVITDADQIYGVSMQEGISKVISLKV